MGNEPIFVGSKQYADCPAEVEKNGKKNGNILFSQKVFVHYLL